MQQRRKECNNISIKRKHNTFENKERSRRNKEHKGNTIKSKMMIIKKLNFRRT